MTHNDIYTKFLIEYDKANVTSSYPALTEYEIATLLDRAYLLLIARKLTGNNTRRAPFEYDIKAIEDLRPLVKTSAFQYVSIGDTATNEFKYKLPNDMLYYLLGVVKYSNDTYDRELLTTVDHKSADNFKATSSNMPWIKKPVAYLEDENLHILLDPYKHYNVVKSKLTARPLITGTYIIIPAKFAIGVPPEEESNEGNNNENNGGNNSGNNNGNNDNNSNDNNNGNSENGGSEVLLWTIYSSSVPNTINNSGNLLSFELYAYKGLEKSRCSIEIISGNNFAHVQYEENYTVNVLVISTGTVQIKIICNEDTSIYTTKLISVIYNVPQNTNNNGNNGGGNENPTGIKYVDLGLPSGTKWADRNLGATSVTDRGKFYGWGEPTGNVISETGQYGDYTLNLRNVTFPADISKSNKDLDAAYVQLGGNWHTPTTKQMLELINNCTFTLQQNYNGVSGLYGYEVRGKGKYSQNTIFIPCNGYRSGVDRNGNPIYSSNINEAYYWSSEISDQPYGLGMFVKLQKGNLAVNKVLTFYGMYIRPVYDGSTQGNENDSTTVVTDEGQNVRMVDLGLSSLWADRNIGANISYDNNGNIVTVDKGEYISWGETGAKESYHYTDYPYYEDNSITNYYYIKPEYDAAKQRWGSNFRMPSTEDIDDLLTKCTATWEEHVDSKGNRVAGMRFTSTNGNSIFLPAGGYTYHDHYNNLTHCKDNDYGYYWSNTKLQPEDKRSSLCILFDLNKDHLDCSWLSRFIGILIRPVSPKQ